MFQGVEQLFAVEPLPWCPHLPSVRPLPPQGLDTHRPCEDCGDVTENWVCLVCYKVRLCVLWGGGGGGCVVLCVCVWGGGGGV